MKCQQIPAEVESAWKYIKNGFPEAAEEIYVDGHKRGGFPLHKETWSRSNDVDNAVKRNRKAWKQRKNGGTKEEYLKAKKADKTAVCFAKRDAQTKEFASINNNSDKNCLFKMAKRLKQNNVDVFGEKCVRYDDGKLTLTVDD